MNGGCRSFGYGRAKLRRGLFAPPEEGILLQLTRRVRNRRGSTRRIRPRKRRNDGSATLFRESAFPALSSCWARSRTCWWFCGRPENLRSISMHGRSIPTGAWSHATRGWPALNARLRLSRQKSMRILGWSERLGGKWDLMRFKPPSTEPISGYDQLKNRKAGNNLRGVISGRESSSECSLNTSRVNYQTTFISQIRRNTGESSAAQVLSRATIKRRQSIYWSRRVGAN